MEPAVGFEPTTDGLQNRCSTTELNWRLNRREYYALLKRAGKQFRRSLKTVDRRLATRRRTEPWHFWLKHKALEVSANLSAPEIIALEITDDLEAALEQFATIAEDLKTPKW